MFRPKNQASRSKTWTITEGKIVVIHDEQGTERVTIEAVLGNPVVEMPKSPVGFVLTLPKTQT